MKTTKDGFVWKLVNDKAKEIFNSGLFELYELHDNDSESLIETFEELNTALDNGSDIGIEVGFVDRMHLNEHTIPRIEFNNINCFDLRSDLENSYIYDTYLVPKGYVGNAPVEIMGEEHEDDTWAIDLETTDGMVVDSYLYTSEFEYEQDLKTLKL